MVASHPSLACCDRTCKGKGSGLDVHAKYEYIPLCRAQAKDEGQTGSACSRVGGRRHRSWLRTLSLVTVAFGRITLRCTAFPSRRATICATTTIPYFNTQARSHLCRLRWPTPSVLNAWPLTKILVGWWAGGLVGKHSYTTVEPHAPFVSMCFSTRLHAPAKWSSVRRSF